MQGRVFILRWFYGVYPFFAYCCAGTEFFYLLLYLRHFYPLPIVEMVFTIQYPLMYTSH